MAKKWILKESVAVSLLTGGVVRIFNSIPQGWEGIPGATTAPEGYAWIENQAEADRDHALVRV